MLGNDVLSSFMVYSRTNIVLFGYWKGTVAASHKGSVNAPDST
jgi:hypothetical protein